MNPHPLGTSSNIISRSKRWALAGLAGLLSLPALAQTGTRDPSFAVGTGIVGSYVHTLALSRQGNIVVGGSFSNVQGHPRSSLAQCQTNGGIDLNFELKSGPNSPVLAVACQPDGKVLLGGAFTAVNNTNRAHIARLLANGQTDFSFTPGTGANGEVRSICLQPDGKILISGPFSTFNGTARSGVARLNDDGTLDATFVPGTGVAGERFVDEVHVLPDGKILIAGDFPTYNNVKRASIARLNSDGSLDLSFDPGTGAKPGDPILGVALQPDGKVLIAGSFTAFNGKPLHNIARLNPDGTVDSAFTPGTGTSGGPINGLLQSVALEPDGKILIGGWFDRVDNLPRSNLARLLPNGRPDTNWNVAVDGQVRVIVLQPDHNILLAGDFTKVANSSSPRVCRLRASQPLPCRFSNYQSLGHGQVRFDFSGDPARTYVLQVSSDLVTWEPWMNTTCPNRTLQLTDPDAAAHPSRFYRALLKEL